MTQKQIEALRNIDEAVELLNDLMYEMHHQAHAPGCRCEYGIRKLRNASAHLRAIHWYGMPDGKCPRKDSGVDARTIPCTTGATVTQTAVASHYGNITCPVCRKIAWKVGVR